MVSLCHSGGNVAIAQRARTAEPGNSPAPWVSPGRVGWTLFGRPSTARGQSCSNSLPCGNDSALQHCAILDHLTLQVIRNCFCDVRTTFESDMLTAFVPRPTLPMRLVTVRARSEERRVGKDGKSVSFRWECGDCTESSDS